jgi:hypothetical protein
MPAVMAMSALTCASVRTVPGGAYARSLLQPAAIPAIPNIQNVLARIDILSWKVRVERHTTSALGYC